MSHTPRYALWYRDEIQFSRLIAELEVVGAFSHKVLHDLRIEMDLTNEDLAELIDRAQTKWAEHKARFFRNNP